MGKNKKIIIGILIFIFIIVIGIFVAYRLNEYNVTKQEKIKPNEDFDSSNSTDIINYNSNINYENYQKYYKSIDNIKIELNIPSEWKYEEMPKDEKNDYKYALKMYKENENQYAILYFYNSLFAVCGTGRTSKNIILNNGKEATIGYYDGNKNWSDISFHSMNEYIAIINQNLINTDADEVIEFIKMLNITKENL